ncbi:hypothetical protein BDV38DRAFT_274872 [Aspergillus pseudotamarii]|uniref:Uncharacterized protein n=1 Tax=Aspergillus pseudotamarii TaxID=132259 RepID=A0A5N6SFW5_ASPPS|nr:uncharacterized protein BDV38DRAFT_274872 [Aspergillus pseudotamarii]KAE8132759.1 hypothetical protein BDV38DRAFT_274872 [Aspergillus pseudotamarii]
MTTTYTINFQNKRGADSNYAVFMEPPVLSISGTSPDAFMNVWYSTFVPNNGYFDIKTGVDYYAWVVTATAKPAPGVMVNTGMSLPARLGQGTTAGDTFNMVIKRNFPTIAQSTPSAVASAYEINTGTDFPVPNERYLIGLGKVNNRGLVAPVASTNPFNNMKIQLTPKMKFYILESIFEAGVIVDYQSVTREAAVIDFTLGKGAGKFYAVVTQDDTGKFTVQYFDNY